MSTDSHFTHLAWINTPRKEGGLGNIQYPLLADKSMTVARSYGVLQEESGISFRGLFIIDGKQNLRQVTVSFLRKNKISTCLITLSRLRSTICQLDVQLMKHFVLFKHSSTLMNMEKSAQLTGIPRATQKLWFPIQHAPRITSHPLTKAVDAPANK